MTATLYSAPFGAGKMRLSVRLQTVLGVSAALTLLALLGGCTTIGPGTNPQTTAKPAQTSATGNNNQQPFTRHPSTQWPPAANLSAPSYDWPSPSEDLWAQVRTGFRLPPNRWRDRVRHWTQFYATHPDHLTSALRRAQPWLYHIVELIEKRDMPTEIALLPIVESAYKPSATSSSGASGLWQFMPATAKYMGLTLNWWYDGRDDPFAATQAALTYLQRLHEHYNGNWLLALAAYNAGPGRVDEALAEARRKDKPTDFWHLNLPTETVNYVPKLLAVRWVMAAPSRFGINWPELANEPKTQLVELPGQINLSIAANLANMPKWRIAELNPDIKHRRTRPRRGKLILPADKVATFVSNLASTDVSALLDNQGDKYRVHPGDTLSTIARRFSVSVAALRNANGLSSNRIVAGQTLRIPQNPGERGVREITTHYTVESGDTLWQIAHVHNTSVAAIRRVNTGLGPTLHPGDRLALPAAGSTAEPAQVVVQRGDTLWSIAQTNNVTVADLQRWNRLEPDAVLHPGQTLAIGGDASIPDYYQVKSGDTLWSIAHRFSMRVATLKRLNGLTESQPIQPGQRLRLQASVSS